MNEKRVQFDIAVDPVHVTTGVLLTEAAHKAGLDIAQPCGGQGRCGRCAMQVLEGAIRSRSVLRLSAEDVERGYVLACQAVVEGDATIHVPPQETLERILTTDRAAAAVVVPLTYDPATDQTIQRLTLTLSPPALDDQRDDWSRLQTAVRQQTNIPSLQISLPLLRKIGAILRKGAWQVTAVLEKINKQQARLIALRPGHIPDDTPLWGVAVKNSLCSK